MSIQVIKVGKILKKTYFVLPLCFVVLSFALHNNNALSSAPVRAAYDGETIYKGIFQGRSAVADLIPEIRDHLKMTNYVQTPAQLEALYQSQDRIVAAIKTMDPSFFDRFKAVMQSGDHLAIQAELAKASKTTIRAVLSFPEVQKALQELSDNPEPLRQTLSELNETLEPDQQVPVDDVEALIRALMTNSYDPFPATCVVLVLVTVAAVAAAVSVAAAVAVSVVSVIAISEAVSVATAISGGGGGGDMEGSPISRRGATTSIKEAFRLTQEQLINSIAERLHA